MIYTRAKKLVWQSSRLAPLVCWFGWAIFFYGDSQYTHTYRRGEIFNSRWAFQSVRKNKTLLHKPHDKSTSAGMIGKESLEKCRRNASLFLGVVTQHSDTQHGTNPPSYTWPAIPKPSHETVYCWLLGYRALQWRPRYTSPSCNGGNGRKGDRDQQTRLQLHLVVGEHDKYWRHRALERKQELWLCNELITLHNSLEIQNISKRKRQQKYFQVI